MFIVLISCNKDLTDVSGSFTIEDAKAWFEINSSTAITNNSSERCNTIYKSSEKWANWNRAKEYQLEGIEVVEVPIVFKKVIDIHQKGLSKKEYKNFYDNIKLIIIKKEDLTVESFIMTLLPDNEMIKSNMFISKSNLYRKLQKKYSGLIVYHTWNGEFISGESYDKGVRNGTVNQEISCGNINNREYCLAETYTVYGRTCTDWYVNGVYVDTTCDEWHEIDSGVYGVCYDSGTGSGGGGTGGTTGNDPYPLDNLDPSKVLNFPKFKCLYEKFMEGNNSLFNQTILPFNNNQSVDLVFETWDNRPLSGDCKKGGDSEYADGCTSFNDIDNGVVTIYINDYNDDPLDLASTVLHEGIHAAIGVYVKNKGVDVRLKSRERLMQLYDHYKYSADADHYYMVETYIKPLAMSLRQVDNYKSSLTDYYPFAWDGLRPYGLQNGLSYSDMYFYNSRTSTYNISILCK
jgi:hypothetical protein